MAETGAASDLNTSVADPTKPGLTFGQRLKAIMGGAAGNLVEWYDWFAYTSFSLYFADQFFHQVFERHKPDRAAIFIHHDGDDFAFRMRFEQDEVTLLGVAR